MEDFASALIACGALPDRGAYEMWYDRLFKTPCPAGEAPWDPWLDREWRKKPRTTFQEIADFYNDDAFVTFQAAQLQAWPGVLSDHLPGLVTSGMHVLDYGCGSGRDGTSCLSMGAEVTFADV